MSILPLSTFDDSVLREEMSAVEEIDDEIRTLVDNMVESMYAYNGVGLAAPQIGVPKQITVMDCSEARDGSEVIAMINPEIVEQDGEQTGKEGCLSLPGIWEDPGRYRYAKAKFLTPEGEETTVGREGLWGRCIQHEVDHLRGTLFIDHLEGESKEQVDDRFEILAEWSSNPRSRLKQGETFDQFIQDQGRFGDMHRDVYDKITVPDTFQQFFGDVDGNYTGAIITEVDRYESAFVLPILVRMFETMTGGDYCVLPLKKHQPIYDFYRSYGVAHPPIVALFDEEMMEIGVWGPRPEKAEEVFQSFQENLSRSEMQEEIEEYYLTDGPHHIYEEFREIIESFTGGS